MVRNINRDEFIVNYQNIRKQTVSLCQPLTTEDYVIQGCEDVSPPKWHLAHTTWFFETFILISAHPSYQAYDPIFQHLFNSYYQGAGKPFPRRHRGLLSRPTVSAVLAYREHIDNAIINFIHHSSNETLKSYYPVLVLGLHHEQQHQELLMMDIKFNYSLDPAYPKYNSLNIHHESFKNAKLNWINLPGGIVSIGHNNESFCYDNELPPHQHFLNEYCISDRLITNGEYLEFIESDGYQQPEWWLSDGWDCIQSRHWYAPLYWQKIQDEWYEFSLSGLHKILPEKPVSHISYFEADAFARYKGARLPTEQEWEHFAKTSPSPSPTCNFLDRGIYQPLPQTNSSHQIWGDLWEWTSSSYSPYPGYKPLPGTLGEYNGKFMSNQMVLRGGSCITPTSHIRASYRNFFAPDKRWQYSGIRLAYDP